MTEKYVPGFPNTPEGRADPGYELLKKIWIQHRTAPGIRELSDKAEESVVDALTRDLSDIIFVGPNNPKSIGEVFSRTRQVVEGYGKGMRVPLTDAQYHEIASSARVISLVSLGIVRFEGQSGQQHFILQGDPSNYIDDPDRWLSEGTDVKILPDGPDVINEYIRLLREK